MAHQAAGGNRLANATSPYLLQHADNPVEWYPWGPEALQAARDQDKPILLSIGYSACHWCHVMAHESFEDPATAELMNNLFINIKVDREERPDLDRIYQMAHQLLAQRPGGWPLTMFLTPDDQTPFFGGTYFPREARHGLPAFQDLLRQIADFYRNRREELAPQNASLHQALDRLSRVSPAQTLGSQPLDAARAALERSFDPRSGGFGHAPKFPHPTQVQRLLRDYARSAGRADRQALHMACFTLRRMALGGLFDQVGGGFARYCVDDYWTIPHFEKMLSDNGLLLTAYADAAHATGDRFFARIALQTGRWMLREMQSPEGGFYSSLDADSEGEEGRFYTWTADEVRALLTDEEFELAQRRFGLDEAPNFEGRWHFHVCESLSELAKSLRRPRDEVEACLESVQSKLYQARSQRVWPHRDEKILTSWNALAIKGLARAGRILDDQRFVDAAAAGLEYLRTRLWRNGRLLATGKGDHGALNAYLDDHAFLMDALLEMIQTRWSASHLAWARELAELLLNRFRDDASGGFFFTSDDHERLIQRPRPLMDEATPSGNGIAAIVLQRLGHLLGESRYLEAAEATLLAAAGEVNAAPEAHGSLLDALEEWLDPPVTVILRGDAETLEHWRREVERYYSPGRVCVAIPTDAETPPELQRFAAGGGAAAYICRGMQCTTPAYTVEELRDRLGRG